MADFMGKSMEYWQELERQSKDLKLDSILEENGRLRQRVYQAEGKISEILRTLGAKI